MKDVFLVIVLGSLLILFVASANSCINSTESFRPITLHDCVKHCHPYKVNTIVPEVKEKTIHDMFLWYKFDRVIYTNMYNVCTCKP
jgi:hypothetical protein